MSIAAASARISFARTKIQAPRPRADLVERPVLEARLGAALADSPVTLLVAPAGWGKTAALTRVLALAEPALAVVWLSLDDDDDLPRVLACLGGALAPLDLPWHVAPTALPVLAQSDHGLRTVSDEILNALADATVPRGVLIVDDLHRVRDPRVVVLLGLLAERVPPAWGLVIASRSEPALPIARWRASGRLAEFRQADLKFRDDEVAALLRREALDEAGAAALAARAEGWAAGLRLMLSPAAQGAGRRELPMRQVFDYLADEVLAAMPAELQRFLMRCSVLPELTPQRCEQVSGLPDAARWFDEVERQGLFVSALDATQRTLRLHDLFRDFLEARLVRDAPEELPTLLQRAADGEADVARALAWLVRAGSWSRAAALLVRHGRELLDAGQGEMTLRVIAQFPPEVRARQPALHLIEGIQHFAGFDFPVADRALALAAEGFERDARQAEAAFARTLMLSARLNLGQIPASMQGLVQQADEAQAQRLGADIEAIAAHYAAWAAFAHGDLAKVAPLYARAVRCLEQDARRKTIEMTYFQTLLAGLPGIDPWMARWERLVAPLFGARACLMRVGLHHVRAVRALGRGELDAAAHALAAAADDIEWTGSPRSALTENLMLALIVHAARGEAEACEAVSKRQLAAFATVAPEYGRAHGLKMLVSLAGAAWLLGRDERLPRLVEAARSARNPAEWGAAAHEHAVIEAMAALARGDAAAAQALLQPVVQPQECATYFSGARARLLLAHAQALQGRLDAASATLIPWLDDATTGGPVGGAVLAGHRVLDALASRCWDGMLNPQQAEVLLQISRRLGRWAAGGAAPGGVGPAATQTPAAAGAGVGVGAGAGAGAGGATGGATSGATGGATGADSGAAARADAAALAGLSEREQEVLTMLADGDSNKLIARRLDLSPHTVKRHVANILLKLGVESRGQAAARLRANGGR